MSNRWENRTEPAPGHGVLYWHILLRDYPAAQAMAATGRERLKQFSGLHFTPIQWLHITTLVVGPADKLGDDDIAEMITSVSGLLAGISPVTVRLGRVLYHPEAIVLKVQPDDALDHIATAVKVGSRISGDGDATSQTRSWVPHATLAYSTSGQAAGPIIAALGTRLPDCEIMVDRINLVVQEGPERLWDWKSIAEIPFGQS
jgi:2'-5' RNA ligase